MGLDDRDALRKLRDAVDPALGSDELIRRFYTRWFAIDISARDLFPPDMGAQRTAFAKAMTWLFTEMIAQRAQEPVALITDRALTRNSVPVSESRATTSAIRPTRLVNPMTDT